jgi:uncharacterized lipoprotein YajG
MVMRRVLLPVVAAALLAGCGLFRPNGSWVEMDAGMEVAPIADAIVVFVAQSVPQTGATIVLAPVPEAQTSHPLAAEVREKLTARGYRLGADGQGRHLRYLVSPYRDQILLRVSLDGLECSVLFGRDDTGRLGAAAPLAMRQKGETL